LAVWLLFALAFDRLCRALQRDSLAGDGDDMRSLHWVKIKNPASPAMRRAKDAF
jgi:hypothetical protein